MNSNLSAVNHSLTMSSREIAALCGKEHDNVRRDIKNMAESLSLKVEEKVEPSAGGRPYAVFMLSKRETLILISGYSVELRAKIIDRWQELEAQASPVPTSFAAALRLAAEQAERMEMLALERDHAVATKAHIGERREATAMNTASQAVKRANKLAVELDRSKQYATVKRMEMQYHGQQFNWRLLKSTATEMGIPAIDVFDANYGTVKAYRADVWREAYVIEIIDAVEA